ncbi:MAG: uncharacterized protein A8A55_2081 [Amphiamblys sp. WSBS2006]|nr:MAG: uncharacterized protein A8A55_2081 [Amphiamblys sp. WSBS2006]
MAPSNTAEYLSIKKNEQRRLEILTSEILRTGPITKNTYVAVGRIFVKEKRDCIVANLEKRKQTNAALLIRLAAAVDGESK